MQFSKIARKVKNQAKINEELHSDRAFEQELILEKQRNRNMLAENAKLIQKQETINQKFAFNESKYNKRREMLEEQLLQKNKQIKDILDLKKNEGETLRNHRSGAARKR